MTQSALDTKSLDLETLRQFFVKGYKDSCDLQVGVEWEKIGIYKDSGKAIDYFGAQGVAGLFSPAIRTNPPNGAQFTVYSISASINDPSSISRILPSCLRYSSESGMISEGVSGGSVLENRFLIQLLD